MSPLVLLIPLGIGVVALVAGAGSKLSQPQYQPPPPGPQDGTRGLQYLQRIEEARAAWVAAKMIPGGAASAASMLSDALDVISGMAQNDTARGNVTAAQMKAVSDRIAAVQSEAGI